jgi:hypothetical protein
MGEYPVREDHPKYDSEGVRVRHGGCSCGQVRFVLRGEPDVVGTCHCTECRKATGGSFLSYADWPRSAFSSTGGAREFAGRFFCPNCGSRLFHLSTDRAEVMLGALDDAPSDLQPTREGWTGRREHWLAPIDGADQFLEDPD